MPARRFALIGNPKSGTKKTKDVLAQILPQFVANDATVEVHLSQIRGHGRELARTLDFSGIDGLCVLGGDGTIHEVLNGIMQRTDRSSLPLGFIPAGTGNSICLDLGIQSSADAVKTILEGSTRLIDVAKVSMPDEIRYCLNIIGWGAAVDINRTAERLRVFGPPRYTAAALWHILWAKPRQARLVLDDQEVGDQFLMVLACNTRYTGKAMQLAPQADLADGKIDIVVVRQASRLQLIDLFNRIYQGTHLQLDFVDYHQVHSFRLETTTQDQLNLDGELEGRSPIAVEMMPRCLRIFGKEAVGRR